MIQPSLVYVLNYGIPLTEHDRVSAVAAIRRTDIDTATNSSDEVIDFLNENGEDFINASLTGIYVHDTRNRRVFGTKGFFQRASLEVTLPYSDLEFYKANYRNLMASSLCLIRVYTC